MYILGTKISFLLGSITWTYTAQESNVMVRFKREYTDLYYIDLFVFGSIASWSYLKVQSVTKVPAMDHFLNARVVTKSIVVQLDAILGKIVSAHAQLIFKTQGLSRRIFKGEKPQMFAVCHINRDQGEQTNANEAYFHSKMQTFIVSICKGLC